MCHFQAMNGGFTSTHPRPDARMLRRVHERKPTCSLVPSPTSPFSPAYRRLRPLRRFKVTSLGVLDFTCVTLRRSLPCPIYITGALRINTRWCNTDISRIGATTLSGSSIYINGRLCIKGGYSEHKFYSRDLGRLSQ